MRQVLCDTSALVALADRNDKYVDPARRYLQNRRPGTILLVPNTVFSESMTTLKLYIGVRTTIEFGRHLLQSAFFQLYRLTEDDEQATWDIFSGYSDKEWSYVDCSILAVAQSLRIAEVFAFDHHFEQMPVLARVP